MITHLSLHSLLSLINLKNTKIGFNDLNEKLRFPRKTFSNFWSNWNLFWMHYFLRYKGWYMYF